MSDQQYKYDRLQAASGGAFRLLYLQPTSGPEVDVVLAESSLETDISYEALSYTWGSADEAHYIQCNGKQLRVTKNCKTALLNLRSSEPRALWVDAICIDQSCVEERNEQVKMMRQIYESASQVIVWLADNSAPLQFGLEVIRIFAKMVREHDNVLPEHEGCQRLMNGDGRVREALTALAEQPWWRRIWVVQEISAAAKAVVRCGNLEVDWDDFQAVAGWVLKTGVKRFPYHLGLIAQRALSMVVLKGRKVVLPSAMLAYENQEATDARDKVFALTGFLRERSGIEVDYSLPVEDVLVLAAAKCLEITQSFDALRPWDFTEDDRVGISRQLPSWVRDISIPRIANKIESWAGYSASKRSKPLYAVHGRELKIRCKIVDEIVFRAAMMTSELEYLYPVLHVWWIAIWSLKIYPTGESLFDVYWQMLSMLSSNKPISGYDEAGLNLTRNIFLRWLNTIAFRNPRMAYAAVRQDQKLLLLQNTLQLPIGLCICTTKKAYAGAVPPMARPGDIIAIPTGATKPYVFRKMESDYYRIIGPCYVHGVMWGEKWMGDGTMAQGEIESDLVELTVT
ncbi:hypothetical protein NKR23_g4229 [Pleurostoma richardsiae]|uniref:Heterokaryon incompatibility domain-containing protein n=1 Tax=Pleurostoma richardsiae TaxID=41990 RepID=A0AA38RVS5_9PEZI|nr:hypothetical protein NKR23_g4229 [Pleurostoma richardsiae]